MPIVLCTTGVCLCVCVCVLFLAVSMKGHDGIGITHLCHNMPNVDAAHMQLIPNQIYLMPVEKRKLVFTLFQIKNVENLVMADISTYCLPHRP